MSNLVVQSEFTPHQLDLIKSTVAKNATDDELKLFLYRCKNMDLDPLKPGEVHFVKYGNNPGSMIVGIEGFRKRAARVGKLTGIKRGVLRDAAGKCIGGWCEVYRSDWQFPAREEVSLSEYSTGKNQWATKPETMIKKCAEVAALRMAFADDLSGLYSEEEMQNNDPRDVKAKELTQVVQETTEAPEFEQADYFKPEPAFEPEGPGDFVFSVGKTHVGKRLKDIGRLKLENFVNYVDGQIELSNLAEGDARKIPAPHADVIACKEKVVDYLMTLEEPKI